MLTRALATLCLGCAASGLMLLPPATASAAHAHSLPISTETPRVLAPDVRAVARPGSGQVNQPLSAGERLTVTATGFAPFEAVSMRLSGDHAKKFLHADSAGSVHVRYNIPTGLTPGDHRVIFEQVQPSPNSADAGAEQSGMNLTVTVPHFAILSFRLG